MMTQAQAIDLINEALRDSGNAQWSFVTIRVDLERETLYGSEHVLLKPPSGYEVLIPTDVALKALGY